MTELIYLDSPDQTKASVKIISKEQDDKGIYLIFDRSIFYPQGGGQPSDCGEIIFDKSNIKYQICDVKNLNNEIRHYLNKDSLDDIKIDINTSATIKIDENRRLLNTQYHTAGHLIAAIAEKIDNKLTAIKGHQFPGEAYVELDGIIDDIENFQQNLESAVLTEINANKTVSTKNLNTEQVKIISEKLPYKLPKNKKLRVCHIEGLPAVPCGGTHVKSLKEIKNISIKKCRSKKGKSKIFYEIV